MRCNHSSNRQLRCTSRYPVCFLEHYTPYLVSLTSLEKPYVHEVRYVDAPVSDHLHTYLAYVDWQMWTAALVTSTSVRDAFVSAVNKYAADEVNSQPLGDWYETLNGDVESFRARPVVGGHFALVSQSRRCPSMCDTQETSSSWQQRVRH